MRVELIAQLEQTLGNVLVAQENFRRVLAYGPVQREVEALEQGAGLIEHSAFRRVEAHGKDRVRFLNGMLSNELKSLVAGQGTYGLLLTTQGKVVADVTVYVFDEKLLLTFSPLVALAGREMLEKFLIADKVTWQEVSDELAQLSLQGPQAGEVLRRCFPGITLPTEPHALMTHALSEGELWIAAEDSLGLGGFELFMPWVHYEPIWRALSVAGAIPVGERAFEVVRIRNGVPQVGTDVGPQNIPLEAGELLEARAIHYKKGCYIGQEVVCRVKSRGHVNWMLTAFALPLEAQVGQRLFSGEKDVGWITSIADEEPSGRRGLGYVHRNARQLGQALQLGSAGSGVLAQLLAPGTRATSAP